MKILARRYPENWIQIAYTNQTPILSFERVAMLDFEMMGLSMRQARFERQTDAVIGQWAVALDNANAEIRRLRIELATAKKVVAAVERGKRLLATRG